MWMVENTILILICENERYSDINRNPIILIQFLYHGTLCYITMTEIRDIYHHFQKFEMTVSVDAYHMFHITTRETPHVLKQAWIKLDSRYDWWCKCIHVYYCNFVYNESKTSHSNLFAPPLPFGWEIILIYYRLLQLSLNPASCFAVFCRVVCGRMGRVVLLL